MRCLRGYLGHDRSLADVMTVYGTSTVTSASGGLEVIVTGGEVSLRMDAQPERATASARSSNRLLLMVFGDLKPLRDMSRDCPYPNRRLGMDLSSRKMLEASAMSAERQDNQSTGESPRRAFEKLFPEMDDDLRPHFEEFCRRVGEKAATTNPTILVAAICAAISEIATIFARVYGEDDHQKYMIVIMRIFAEGHDKPKLRKISEIARHFAEPYKPRNSWDERR